MPLNPQQHGQCSQRPREAGKGHELYKKAIAIKHDHADAHNNMGDDSPRTKDKLEEAIERAYNKAISTSSQIMLTAYNNMGNALQRPREAGRGHRRLTTKQSAIKPDHADAYNNMGATLQDQGKLEEAIELAQATQL